PLPRVDPTILHGANAPTPPSSDDASSARHAPRHSSTASAHAPRYLQDPRPSAHVSCLRPLQLSALHAPLDLPRPLRTPLDYDTTVGLPTPCGPPTPRSARFTPSALHTHLYRKKRVLKLVFLSQFPYKFVNLFFTLRMS
ncbi:hypothetical protein T484DRAFT_1608225, partial [Baffinella frigidus]